MFRIIVFISLFLGLNSIFAQKLFEFESYIIKVNSPETILKIKAKFPSIHFSETDIFRKSLDAYSKNMNNLLSIGQSSAFKNLENYYVMNIPSQTSMSDLLIEINSFYGILILEKNITFRIEEVTSKPEDPLFPQQWGLQSVYAEKAWEKASGRDVIVGVVDTGIEWDHPDLQNQLWVNSKEDINGNHKFDPWPDTVKINGVTGDLNGKDDDGNGYTDDVIGYSFVNQFVPNLGQANEFSPIPVDEHSHGTLVSGVIAAQRNSIGVVGLAYNAKIMTLRAFDATGNAQSDNIATAIVYGAMNGAKVLNFSFGEDLPSTIVHDAIKFAYTMGCVMSASSGNNGWAEMHFPSDFEEVISVGSSTSQNQRDYLSNYGTRIGLLAPGVSIMTTNFGKDYKTASGTSLSAPFVSATAALLFEINPTLKPKDIYGIMEATATDVEQKGWDEKSGAGVLNAGAAVNFPGATNLAIDSPSVGRVIDISKFKSPIPVIGTVLTPLFSSFQVMIGQGTLPQKWINITDERTSQIKNDTLAEISTKGFVDTVYTLRLLVKLKNNTTIEKRTYFSVVTDSNSLRLESLKIVDSWFGGKRAVVISCVTNELTEFKVKYRPNNSTEDFSETSDKNYESYYHTIVLSDEIPKDVLMEAQAVLKRNDGVEIIRPFSFIRKKQEMTSSNFSVKYNTLPLLYLNNQVADLYGDGNMCFAGDDISYGLWQSTKIFEFKGNEFILKDSLQDIWIPVAFGESNGDGIPEIFTKSYGASILFQAKQKGVSPFSSIIFQDTLEGNLRAAGMFDFDKNGLDELIAFSDTAFHIFSFKNGKYSQITQTNLQKPLNKIGTAPGSAFGDFNGDGINELAFINEDGQVFIFSYQNGTLVPEFTDLNKSSSSPQIMCKADIDGDGIPELVILNYGGTALFGKENTGDEIWDLKILKSTGQNNYNYVANEYFFGVRSGSTRSGVTYRNGLSAGNVDGIIGDEIIVSPFPDLYVFKWNIKKKILEPFWWHTNSFANSSLVYDFDKNGVNEIGFSSGNGTKFYEYNSGFSGPLTPTGFDGYSINDSTAILYWDRISNATDYDLYNLFLDKNNYYISKILRTDKDTVYLTGLKPNINYQFLLQSYNSQLKDTVSDYSRILDVYTHNPIKLIEVSSLGNRILKLKFSGKIPWKPLESDLFLIINSINDTIYATNANRLNDSICLLNIDKPLTKGIYNIFAKSFKDFYRTPSLPSIIQFEILKNEENPIEIILTKLEVINNYMLKLQFSFPVEATSSLNLQNYTLKPSGRISNITAVNSNPDEVLIELDKTDPIGALGLNYTLTARDIYSTENIPITKGAGNTLGFVFYADNPNDAFIYPNPVKLTDKKIIYFANLTPRASVYVLTLGGELLNTLTEIDGNGGVEWDGKDRNGIDLDSGIYLFKVKGTGADGKEYETGFKKFAIVK